MKTIWSSYTSVIPQPYLSYAWAMGTLWNPYENPMNSICRPYGFHMPVVWFSYAGHIKFISRRKSWAGNRSKKINGSGTAPV